jgi:hypothetical protein
VGLCSGLIWLGCGQVVNLYETTVGHLGFMKDGKFVDHLSDCQCIKKDTSAWSYLHV